MNAIYDVNAANDMKNTSTYIHKMLDCTSITDRFLNIYSMCVKIERLGDICKHVALYNIKIKTLLSPIFFA